MRRAYLLAVLFCVSCFATAQERDGYFGIQVDHSQFKNLQFTGLGFNAKLKFGKHLSFGYSIMMGWADGERFYLYTGAGQAAGVFIFKETSTLSDARFAIPLGIVAFVIPETIAVDIPLNEHIGLTVFLSPFGFERWSLEGDQGRRWEISGEYGLKFQYNLGQMAIIPYMGYKEFWDEDEGGAFNIGVSFMFARLQ